jgi:ActR/RegA family two-component response regulator
MPLFAPAVIVFEKAPRWESELKRRFDAQEVLVRPCRSAGDVLTLCRQAPGSIVVADFAAGTGDVLRLLEKLISHRTYARPLVIGSVDFAGLEWSARDLGAVAFVTDRINGGDLADFCRRILFADQRLRI